MAPCCLPGYTDHFPLFAVIQLRNFSQEFLDDVEHHAEYAQRWYSVEANLLGNDLTTFQQKKRVARYNNKMLLDNV